MKESKSVMQRKLAQDIIVKALETLHPDDTIQYNKEMCGGSEYHKKLTPEQIDNGIVAFITLNSMSAGSQGDFDLYRLLHKYILDRDVRKEINGILRKRIYEVRS